MDLDDLPQPWFLSNYEATTFVLECFSPDGAYPWGLWGPGTGRATAYEESLRQTLASLVNENPNLVSLSTKPAKSSIGSISPHLAQLAWILRPDQHLNRMTTDVGFFGQALLSFVFEEHNLPFERYTVHQSTLVHTNLIRFGSCILRITSMLTKFMQS